MAKISFWFLGITMHLTRCKDQKRSTLEEFYSEARDSGDYLSRKCGEAMLILLARLRALPDERQIYGLTSHYHLCLLSQDTYTSPWFVKVTAMDEWMYVIEYLMPKDEAPWPYAYVRGEAQSPDLAIRMIITAMEKSGGWS